MSDAQNLTNGEKSVVEFKTDWRHDAWVDYRALNGTIIDFDEESQQETVRKLSMAKLAEKLGVSRETLYDWEKRIPNFWDRVAKRSKELSGQRRLSLMNDKFYIHAMTWKNPMISLKWLEQNDAGWKDPRFKVEHTADDSFAGLLRQLEADKQAKEQPKVIEAEVTTYDVQPDGPASI